MANRIILSAVITLALTFTPSLAFSVPTKSVKKKSTGKNQSSSKVSSKSKSAKKSSRSRTQQDSGSRSRGQQDEAVQASIVPLSGSKAASASVPETPPLMKVTPQRDGRFILEPLSPKKPVTPLTKPSSKPEIGRDQSSLQTEPKYNRFEPWNFSELILTQAKHYRDTPYSRGGSLQSGYATDCSGFVQFIYHGFKIDLPRSSAEQAQVGKVVTRNMDFSKLLPGDLLFFRRGGRSVGHAGIYLGEGRMIHASNHRNGVTVTDLRQPYYEGTFVVAKRVFEVKYPN
jgi:cell wall-associated NlpC family hydrolase